MVCATCSGAGPAAARAAATAAEKSLGRTPGLRLDLLAQGSERAGAHRARRGLDAVRHRARPCHVAALQRRVDLGQRIARARHEQEGVFAHPFALAAEAGRQRLEIVISRNCRFGRDLHRHVITGRRENMAAIAKLRCGNRQHPAQLSPAQYADSRTRR